VAAGSPSSSIPQRLLTDGNEIVSYLGGLCLILDALAGRAFVRGPSCSIWCRTWRRGVALAVRLLIGIGAAKSLGGAGRAQGKKRGFFSGSIVVFPGKRSNFLIVAGPQPWARAGMPVQEAIAKRWRRGPSGKPVGGFFRASVPTQEICSWRDDRKWRFCAPSQRTCRPTMFTSRDRVAMSIQRMGGDNRRQTQPRPSAKTHSTDAWPRPPASSFA